VTEPEHPHPAPVPGAGGAPEAGDDTRATPDASRPAHEPAPAGVSPAAALPVSEVAAAPDPGVPRAPESGTAIKPKAVSTPETASVPRRAPPALRRRRPAAALAERPEIAIEVSRRRLAARSRREFLLFGAGILTVVAGAWWLLPDRAKSRLLPGAARERLDTLAARVGLSRARRERTLNRAIEFDDDVAEALYSKDRRVRTYHRSEVTPLRNNYDGQTPGPEYLPTWTLNVSGLASGRLERLTIGRLLQRFPLEEQVTRLVCVEGWSAVAWWRGIRFADFLGAFPPAPGARWAAIRSSVNLDAHGRPDPYYVSIDLETARHPQTLLATHLSGAPLTLAHGAPLRLLAPMKLGLKNIKAITEIEYAAVEPPDYWNERGYSQYDGL